MSIHIVVFIADPARLPSAAQWSEAAAEGGFEFSVHREFDPAAHKGALPVRCDGIDAAFEYYCDPIAEYLADVDDLRWWERITLRRFRLAVDLVTHSRIDDRFAAIVGAASLAHVARGLLLDCTSGKWVKHPNALQWARSTAHPPSGAVIAGREATTRAIAEWAVPIVTDLGYEPLIPPPRPYDGAGQIWFVRDGKPFRHEMISFSLGFDGEEAFLVVTFFGTPYPLSTLARRGFSGNGAGWYLFQVLENALGRAYDEILPQNIAVDANFAATPTAERLRREIIEADAIAFPQLRKSLEADGEWWPDAP